MNQVRAAFEHPAWYLESSRFNLRLRSETVQEITKGRVFARILDVGCGDGSISLPLLRQDNCITLVDFSSAMLREARRHIPPELVENVHLFNADFLSAPLAGPYDLILCIGFLAHTSSLEAVIAKMTSLLDPDGILICQITDSQHAMTQIVRLCAKLSTQCGVAPETHAISTQTLVGICARYGLSLEGVYRYSSPLPGMRRILSDSSLYRLIRLVHGHYHRNRHSLLGNEVICVFRHHPRVAD